MAFSGVRVEKASRAGGNYFVDGKPITTAGVILLGNNAGNSTGFMIMDGVKYWYLPDFATDVKDLLAINRKLLSVLQRITLANVGNTPYYLRADATFTADIAGVDTDLAELEGRLK